MTMGMLLSMDIPNTSQAQPVQLVSVINIQKWTQGKTSIIF